MPTEEEAVILARIAEEQQHDVPLLVPVVTDESVLAALADAVAQEAAARTAHNKAKNALAAAEKARKAASEFAAAHYNESRQLGLVLTVGGTEPIA